METDEARQRIGGLVIERYGVAAHLLALIHQALLRHPPSQAVPIRLEPLDAARGTLPSDEVGRAAARQLGILPAPPRSVVPPPVYLAVSMRVFSALSCIMPQPVS